MIVPHVERNPAYTNGQIHQEKIEQSNRHFPIYKKQKPQKTQSKPPKKLKTRELFDFLNIWDCEIVKRHNYLSQFNSYLAQKRETIELEEIEKKMRKPDFLKFFKYLQENKPESDNETNEDVNIQIAFTAQQRRDLNAQERFKKKNPIPKIQESNILLPSSFNPKFQVPSPSPDDFIIVTHFFQSKLEVPQTSIQKNLICSYILENRKFVQAYNINKNLLEYQLNDFPTKFEEDITLEEFINFILYPKTLIIHQQTNQQLLKKIKGNNIFEQDELNKLLKIYDDFNLDCEEKVNPIKLIQAIRTRYETRILLFKNFIQIMGIEKLITFDKWLYELEVYCLTNQLEYISKFYFKEYQNQLFDIPSKLVILQMQKLSHRKKYDKDYENEDIYLPTCFFSQLETIFFNIRKMNERFSQKKLIVDNIITTQDFYNHFKNRKVRKEKTNQLPIETVEQTLNRLLIEADDYIDIDELIDFFTIRGRPLWLSHKLKQQYSEQIKKIELKKGFGAINKEEDELFLITIPNNKKEIKQSKTIRQKEIEKVLINKEKQILKEINTKFQANPVPWYVKEPLYDQFNREREERRNRIKEESKSKLLQSMMKPMSFEKQKKEIHYEPEIEFKYLARPVPPSTLEFRYKQIVEEQKLRSTSNVERKKAEWADYFANSNQLISKQLREELRLARKRLKNKNAYEPEQFKKFRAKSLPNFEKLHTIFENIIASRKQGFVPTKPCQTNLSTTHQTLDLSMFDNRSSSNLKTQERLADIDRRLENILKTPKPNIIKTKASCSISSLRRKQRYDKEQKQKQINDELKEWKNERKALLPKGIKIADSAGEQQKILDQELEELVKWKKKYHKNLDKDYQNDLKKMQKRVQKRKLLRFQCDDNQENSDSESSKSSENVQQINYIDKFL